MNTLTLLSYLIAVVGTGLSAYFDLKTTYIPDEITHSMIVLGVLLLFIRFNPTSALIYLGIAVTVFVLGFLVYTLGQLGGGDVKLYTALALLVPTFDTVFKFPSPPYPPIVSIFFTSAVFGSFFISLRYLAKIIADRKKIKNFNKKILVSLTVFSVMLALAYAFLVVSPGFSIILVMISVGALIYPFNKDVMHMYAMEYKEVSKLTEDDIIAVDKLDKETAKCLGLSVRKTYLSFELEKIKKRAKKCGVDVIPVYENLPTFGAYIFIGLLFTILFGDMIFTLLSVF